MKATFRIGRSFLKNTTSLGSCFLPFCQDFNQLFSLALGKRRAEEGIHVYRIVLCFPDEIIRKENLSLMNSLLATFVIAFSMHVPTARLCFMFKILTIYLKAQYGLPISNYCLLTALYPHLHSLYWGCCVGHKLLMVKAGAFILRL